jgi:hypothetical protein
MSPTLPRLRIEGFGALRFQVLASGPLIMVVVFIDADRRVSIDRELLATRHVLSQHLPIALISGPAPFPDAGAENAPSGGAAHRCRSLRESGVVLDKVS